MAVSSPFAYQDALRTPGINPSLARLRKQIRHTPNLRYTARARPQIWEVILYDRPDPRDNVRSGILKFSDGSEMPVGRLPNDGAPYPVEFDLKTVSWVQFDIVAAVGPHTGLGEIEVFGVQ